MKIKQIYDVLKDNVDKLHLVTETDNNNYTNVTNVQSVANALRNIGQLGTLVSLEKFKTAHAQFYSLHEDNYTTFSNNITPLKVQIHAIKSEAQSLINTLEILLPKEDGFILSVKLLEYEELDKLPTFYDNLDSTFSPLVKYFGLNDTLEIYSFENGSKWNDFIVRNHVTLGVLIAFIGVAGSFSSDYSNIQKNKLEMEQIHLEIELKESEKQALDKIYEQQEANLYQKYTNEFIEIMESKKIAIDNQGKEEAEIEAVVTQAYKSYAKLDKDGTEFYADISGEHDDIEEIEKQIEGFNISQKKLSDIKKPIYFQKDTTKLLNDSFKPEDSIHEEISEDKN